MENIVIAILLALVITLLVLYQRGQHPPAPPVKDERPWMW
jgi:hypothetical protein